jgi:hypothetical protein
MIDNLKAFAAVIDCKSLTKAASRLFLTQSAISRRIQQLEEALGGTLLDRTERPPTRRRPGDPWRAKRRRLFLGQTSHRGEKEEAKHPACQGNSREKSHLPGIQLERLVWLLSVVEKIVEFLA